MHFSFCDVRIVFIIDFNFEHDIVLVEEFIRAYDEFAASVAAFDKILTDNSCRIAGEPGTIGRIAGLNYAGTSIAKLKSLNLPKGLICCDDTESAYLSLRDAVYACKDALAKKAALCNDWQDGFLDLDGAALLSELMTAKAKNALVRGMAEGNVYKKVKAYDKGNHKETLEQAFKLLTEYKNSVLNATNYITSVRGYLGELYNPGVGFPGFDISYVESLNENAHAALAEFTAFDPTGMVRKLVGNGDAFLSDAVNAFNVISPSEGGQSIIMYSYFSFMTSNFSFKRFSLPSMSTNSTSAPAKLMSDGHMSKFFI